MDFGNVLQAILNRPFSNSSLCVDLNYLKSSIHSEKMKNVNEEAVSLLWEDEGESICAYIQGCRIRMCEFGRHFILYYFFPISLLSLSPLSGISLKEDPGTYVA